MSGNGFDMIRFEGGPADGREVLFPTEQDVPELWVDVREGGVVMRRTGTHGGHHYRRAADAYEYVGGGPA